MAITGPSSVKKPSSSACRCLFGKPDHEKVRKDLDRALREMDRSTKASLKSKWGFDLDSETGVPGGRYEYTEVGPLEYVPEFYKKGYCTRTKRFTPRDSVEMVCADTRMDLTAPSVDTVSTSTQAGNGLESGPVAARTIITGVRKLVFKENCVNSGSTTTTSQRSRNRSSSAASSLSQSTMTDHFQPRKRRSPDCETSLPRGKSPRL